MTLSPSLPRVNFELLERFVNKRVLLVGKVDQAEGGRAKIKAADGGIVTVELRENNSTFETPYCEFQGIVTSPNSLKEESRTHFGGSFEMSTYNELCKLATSDYSKLFS